MRTKKAPTTKSASATPSTFNMAEVERIARMTNLNAHSEALVTGARMLGAYALAEKAAMVNELVNLEGCMPPGLSDYSRTLYDAMMTFAERTLSPTEYERFRKAF